MDCSGSMVGRLLTALVPFVAAAMVIVASLAHTRSDDPKNRVTTGLAVPAELASLDAGLRSAMAAERLRSAVRLLELGETQAGDVLLDLVADSDTTARKTAATEFGRVAVRMGEAIGSLLDWPASGETSPTSNQLVAARAFWEQKATDVLLRDVQDRLVGTDWRWLRINDMLAIRDRLYRLSRD